MMPFIISNCLTGDRDMNFPTYLLLSICDKYGIAMLSTNLPPREKRKFAIALPQFQQLNKIVG